MATVDRARAVRRNTVLLAAAQGLIQVAFPVMLVVGSVAAVDLTGRDSAAGILVALYFVAAAGRLRHRAGHGSPGPPARPRRRLSVRGGGGRRRRPGGAVGILSRPARLHRPVRAGERGREPRPRGRRRHAPGGGPGPGRGVPPRGRDRRRGREPAPDRAPPGPGRAPPPDGPPRAALGARARRGGRGPGLRARRSTRSPGPRGGGTRGRAARWRPGRRPQDLFRLPAFRTAVVAAAVGQMAMVAVMGVTPVALHHQGDSSAAVSGVISFHIAGMLAFSPLIGAALDRWGRRPGLLVGAAMSGVGALVASTAADAWLVGVGLFAIGLGWSATYLGATAVISDITAPGERGGALGFTDLLISVSSAGAGIAAGYVFEGAGFRVLGIAVAVLVASVLLTLLRLRDAAPVARPVEVVLDE